MSKYMYILVANYKAKQGMPEPCVHGISDKWSHAVNIIFSIQLLIKKQNCEDFGHRKNNDKSNTKNLILMDKKLCKVLPS